jgi:hypothetical protein
LYYVRYLRHINFRAAKLLLFAHIRVIYLWGIINQKYDFYSKTLAYVNFLL